MTPQTIRSLGSTSSPRCASPFAHPTLLSVFAAAAILGPSISAHGGTPDQQPSGNVGPTPVEAPQVAIARGSHIDHSRMYYDAPGDGSLWARGASYKASFDASGATYYPALGKRAPHNMPHALSPDSVTIGGASIAFEREASATRESDRVTIDRGSFVETYDLAPESVEQTFVFSSLPRSGDLVVHIPVASEMEAVETASGLEFRSDLGRVAYASATAIDARGHRSPAATHLENGAITIRVDSGFLASATLPLVIDPFITAVFVTGIPNDDFSPDSSWDPFNQVWLVVYAETFTASDIDVFAKAYSNTGTLDGQVSVDISGDAWTTPRIANNAANHQFLVVAERTNGTMHTIRGRIVHPNGTTLTQDAQFDVSDNTVTGDKTAPSIGGNPAASPTTTSYCVAYTEAISASDSQIVYRLVTPVSTAGARVALAHVAAQPESEPSVSKSNDASNWLIAWRRGGGFPVGNHIWAAHVAASGSLVDGPFQVSGALNATDNSPSASSPLHGSQRSAIAFTRTNIISGNPDIEVAALDGTTVLQIVDLNALESNGIPSDLQADPAIDSDGRHFLVVYSEQEPITATYDTFASDLYLAGSTLGLSESHILLQHFGLDVRNSHISAAHDATGTSHRFFPVYDVLENSTDHDVAGALFDVVEAGTTSLFCAGTAAACPCGNVGTGTNGCANSVTAAGAGLAVSGTPSTLSDTINLLATGMPPSTSCLFFQGTTVGSAAAFGDGLRCATGTVVRLATKTTSVAGSSNYPGAGDSSVSTRGLVTADGGERTYQVWYRNAAAFCTSSTFNLSNGAIIDWAR